MSAAPIRVRSRILTAAILPAVVVAVALAGILLGRQYRSLDEALQARAVAEARQLASAAEFGVFADSREMLSRLCHAAKTGDPDITAVAVLGAGGAVLASCGANTPAAWPKAGKEERIIQHGRIVIVLSPILRTVFQVEDIYSGAGPVGPVPEVEGYVVLEMSRAALDRERDRQLAIGLAVAAGGLLLAAWLATRIAQGVTRPIFHIGEVVSRIGRGDLSARVVPDAGEVMPALEEGINLMARRIGFAQEHLVHQIEEATAELRQRTDEAERANLAKMRFLAAASHDLRQPIHAQGLFLDLLGRTALTADQRQILGMVRASSQASAEMLNTLLDFSRIEAGVIHPVMRDFPLEMVLDKMESEFAPQAVAKGLVFRLRETEVAVRADPSLTELIIRNLVSNAIRYTTAGGVLLACRRRGREVCLEVWDTGIGISPEHQQEVFREFHQLGNPERDRQKGLGLGLAIAEGLAQAMGLRLWVSSAPGRGSVFRLALPVAEAYAVLDDETDERRIPVALCARILVIDDDPAVRTAMTKLLTDWGCECVAVESIEEALEAARRLRPQVVISDYRLRGQRSGAEAIAALRAECGDDLPALLVTGDTAPDRIREATASNIPLVHKPVSPELLYRWLAELLQSEENVYS